MSDACDWIIGIMMQIGIGCRIHDDRPILKRIASRIAMHACAMELIILMLLLFQQHCALRKGMSSNIDIIYLSSGFSVQNIFIYICIKCCSSFLVHMVNITMFVVGSSIATVHTDIRKPQTNFKHQNAWVGIRGVYIPYLFLNMKEKTGFLHGEDCWTWKAIAQGGMEQTFWSGEVSPSIFFHKRHAVCTARFPRAAHASTGRGCAL